MGWQAEGFNLLSIDHQTRVGNQNDRQCGVLLYARPGRLELPLGA
jgi:hypothetical protein